jgi:hypothetical protein
MKGIEEQCKAKQKQRKLDEVVVLMFGGERCGVEEGKVGRRDDSFVFMRVGFFLARSEPQHRQEL